ncbi:hypothetical protein Moror_9485 [Moniliophthora roreri MCA 2997]|uniref:Uncharacterized protein n=1 Tax=Moniliophthora roreri (strain MCA 2997) TaxID=1381753 RepID=V2X0G5_MONRO|nr:hypothetical protein Moror_9485 [Moniliophthora roreri MCA 2997]
MVMYQKGQPTKDLPASSIQSNCKFRVQAQSSEVCIMPIDVRIVLHPNRLPWSQTGPHWAFFAHETNCSSQHGESPESVLDRIQSWILYPKTCSLADSYYLLPGTVIVPVNSPDSRDYSVPRALVGVRVMYLPCAVRYLAKEAYRTQMPNNMAVIY